MNESINQLINISPLQFYVMAKDLAGAEEKNSTTLVYIRVKRDVRPPIFESLPYATAIKETQEINQPFFNLRGRDDDKMVRLIS